MSEERTRAGKMTFPKGPSKDDHRTPIDILVQLTREMGVPTFDLDAAASGENRVCWVYYDQEKDGLKQPWMGKTWCNPPYRQIPQWVEKAHREASNNLDVELVWMLLPCRPSTRWFRYVMATAAEIRLIHGRLKFHGPHEVANSSAPFPSMLVRYGGDSYAGHVLLADRTGKVIIDRRNGHGMREESE